MIFLLFNLNKKMLLSKIQSKNLLAHSLIDLIRNLDIFKSFQINLRNL